MPVRLTNRRKARTNTTCTHRKSGKPSFRLSPQSFRKVVRPPFNILNFSQKQGRTQTNRRNTLTLKKAHHVQTVTKIEGLRQANSFTLFIITPFLPNTTLSSKVTARPCWEKDFQERGYRRCARNPRKKTCPHFLPSHRHRCCKQGFLGSHTSTHLSAQEKSHRPKGILLSHHVETDQHAFTVSAGMQGPSPTTFPRVQIRTNTSPQRFVPHLWHHAWALSAGSHWKPRLPPLSPSPSLPPPKPFWLKPFPVQTFAVVFPLTSFSGFDLSMCLQLSFVVSHLFSWRVVPMGQTCLYLVHQLLLRISVLRMVPTLISTEWLITHMTHNSKRFEMFCHHSCRDSKTWTNTQDHLGGRGHCHLQNYWCRTDCQYPLCQSGVICRDGATCQRPFTERLLQFPCEQFHAGVSTWFDKFLATADIPAANRPIKIHFKRGSRSARLVFETRAKCREFVVRFKDDGVQCLYIMVRQSKSQDDREIGKRFAPLWNALSKIKNLQELFPESDIEGNFIVPSLDVRAQVLNIYDRRHGGWKHVFKLAPPGHDQMFATTAPRVCEPHISDDELRQVICQASPLAQNRTANVWWPLLRLLAFPPLGESRLLFLRRYALVGFSICGLSVQMYGPSWPSIGRSVHASCGRPFDITSCFFHSAHQLGKCWL